MTKNLKEKILEEIDQQISRNVTCTGYQDGERDTVYDYAIKVLRELRQKVVNLQEEE